MATGFINDDFGVNIESVQLQQYFGVQYSNFNLYYSSAYVIANIDFIDDKKLLLACVSNKFKRIENNDIYEYYHIRLQHPIDIQRFGIWANGILTETIFSNL